MAERNYRRSPWASLGNISWRNRPAQAPVYKPDPLLAAMTPEERQQVRIGLLEMLATLGDMANRPAFEKFVQQAHADLAEIDRLDPR